MSTSRLRWIRRMLIEVIRAIEAELLERGALEERQALHERV
jgi:hypothetical protein